MQQISLASQIAPYSVHYFWPGPIRICSKVEVVHYMGIGCHMQTLCYSNRLGLLVYYFYSGRLILKWQAWIPLFCKKACDKSILYIFCANILFSVCQHKFLKLLWVKCNFSHITVEKVVIKECEALIGHRKHPQWQSLHAQQHLVMIRDTQVLCFWVDSCKRHIPFTIVWIIYCFSRSAQAQFCII